MKYQRILPLLQLIKQKSVLLLGPRQTGKTTLIQYLFPKALNYNLLKADVFFQLSENPQLIREEILALPKNYQHPIVIDEIQKLPILLDEVHYLIEATKHKFIITGSSARKLKRSGANLLAGRARVCHLFPLVSAEIPNYNFIKLINHGSIPFIYDSKEPKLDMRDYLGTYLQQEIKAESLTRRIEHFAKFLRIAALYNSELINFTNIANDAGINVKTVAEYYSILEDTLLGYILEPYTKTTKRKAIQTGKFYLFDVGVANFLTERSEIKLKTELFGKAFEHFIFCELKAYLNYFHPLSKINFWQSTSGYEVDFLINGQIAIEAKGTEQVGAKHLKSMLALGEELKFKKQIIVSMDKAPRKMNHIDIMPIAYFLKKLWNHEII